MPKFLLWFLMIAGANAWSDSTDQRIVSTAFAPRYWTCTETVSYSDPSNSKWWNADGRGGQWGDKNGNVWCSNHGRNPANSFPIGLSDWKRGSSESPRFYYRCGHIVPRCGWQNGPAPR